MNLVEASIDGDEVVFGSFRLPLAPERRPGSDAQRVVLGMRPESFEDDAFASPELPRIEVTVEVLEELGSDAHVFFLVDAPKITHETLEASDEDDTSLLAIESALFTARVDARTRAHVGDPLRLAVDPQRFHFFDPVTGESLLRRADPAPVAAPPEAPVHA
jgi:ABC-type sugar transport system ATPase subunit